MGLKNTYFGGKIVAKKNESKSYKYAQNWIAEAETDLSIPLKIAFTKEGSTLIAEPTDQGASPLEATAKDKFSFDMAGAMFEFHPDQNTMVLKQDGAEFHFKKE